MKLNWLYLVAFCFISNIATSQVNLNPCIENTAFKVVILGSSTAAGSGPSSPDSAWVNRYRNQLQQINQNNEVVNLAVGGYTTYKVMPTDFIAPANRPIVDTNRNITTAFTHNPDFIIVNLPSNDRQFPIGEQLANFDSLYRHSNTHEVPIYICTTQPIDALASAAYQKEARDSIISMFPNNYIEFFTPLADVDNTVITQYAADAVHLNDSGHRILFNQVWNRDILSEVFSPGNFPDLVFNNTIYPGGNCADSTAQIGWVIANIGTSVMGNIGFGSSNINGIQDSNQLVLLSNLGTCQTDTIWTTHNLSQAGIYNLLGNITLAADTAIANNSYTTQLEIVKNPILSAIGDTFCIGQSAQLTANLLQGDTMFWYTSLTDSIPESSYIIPNLQTDSTIYVQGVSGNLKFENELNTTDQPNINFNGNMFDLVADKNIELTEIEIRIHSTGNVPVNLYIKSGSYRGSENQISSWVLHHTENIQINTSGDYGILHLPSLNMIAGDTLGIYIHMAQSADQLKYRSLSDSVSYGNNELTYLSGSGIAYQFGAIYDNREIAARFRYEYGFNRFGQCATPLIPKVISISDKQLTLGSDTILDFTGAYIYAAKGFNNYVWTSLDNGNIISYTDSVYVNPYLLMPGSRQVTLMCSGIDKWGCESSDTISIELVEQTSISDPSYQSVNVYPNPTKGVFNIEADAQIIAIKVIDFSGQAVYQSDEKSYSVSFDLGNLSNGLYLVQVYTNSGVVRKMLIKN